MPLAVQYLKGGVVQGQFGLDVADYTSGSLVCNNFYVVKDSQDNSYILCLSASATTAYKAKVIKISSTGNKTIGTINIVGSASGVVNGGIPQVSLSRDENSLLLTLHYYLSGYKSKIYSTPVDFTNGGELVMTDILGITYTDTTTPKFASYQDRYIWVASGTTVKIYDYTTKAELASLAVTAGSLITCSSDNTLYGVNENWFNNGVVKYVFNGINTITKTVLNASGITNNKQPLLDKYGDLIILTNSGTASTLLKYTTAGVQVGTALDLGGAFYNLNTDALGNYYYSNALGSYKISANTAQGQAFSGLGVLRRGSGMTTYGNNTEGYNPAVFGPQE